MPAVDFAPIGPITPERFPCSQRFLPESFFSLAENVVVDLLAVLHLVHEGADHEIRIAIPGIGCLRFDEIDQAE